LSDISFIRAVRPLKSMDDKDGSIANCPHRVNKR
jgi:hypothetical protein